MAEGPDSSATRHDSFNTLIDFVWGPDIKEEVFRRWSQGFIFGQEEPSALVQCEGGPCAVLAPVQAFILKSLLSVDRNWQQLDTQLANEFLVSAACDILGQAHSGNTFVIVHSSQDAQPVNTASQHEGPKATADSTGVYLNIDQKNFHEHLRIKTFKKIQDVQHFLQERVDILQNTFGVLFFLYSVLLTKGLSVIREEVNDVTEPLIDSTFGYGSQSLINLMLTGRAVAHVWDNDQDVGGLKLKGVAEQGEVGFLAFMEHLRYCEVGSYLKNPRQPIWVLASETHLTVVFSRDKRLVFPDSANEEARRAFRSFDPDGNNFISASHLEDVLRQLDLVCDKEYVQIMTKKLDPENLGIILQHMFLDEFFPEDRPAVPDTFTLFHYNGLARSHADRKVRYQEGTAILLECDVKCVLDSNPMLTCLQTKWPNIELAWLSGTTPSLN